MNPIFCFGIISASSSVEAKSLLYILMVLAALTERSEAMEDEAASRVIPAMIRFP